MSQKVDTALNQRQQAYLICIYREDQAAKQHESWRWHQGYDKRPADTWRWIRYGIDTAGFSTPLKRRLDIEGLVDAAIAYMEYHKDFSKGFKEKR